MQVDIIYKGFPGLFYMREVVLTFQEWNTDAVAKKRWMAASALIGWSEQIKDCSPITATVSQSEQSKLAKALKSRINIL